jgi:hypothetical protein
LPELARSRTQGPFGTPFGRRDRGPLRPWVSHGFMVAGLLLTAFQLTQGRLAAELVREFLALIAVVAVVIGMRYNQAPDRAPWTLFALALVTFELEQLCWVVNIARSHPVAGPIGNALDLLGFLILGVAALVALRSRRDLGGVLDVAALSVAAATAIWEFLMFGRLMEGHPPPYFLVSTLLQLLIVTTGLVVLLRLVHTWPGTPPTLWYFVLVVAGGFVQVVVFPLVSTDRLRTPGSLKRGRRCATGRPPSAC